MNSTQHKGDIAVAHAIAVFTELGFDVSIPVADPALYDLVIDTGQSLKRVQVHYTSTGEVDLRRVHSSSSGYKVKKTSRNAYDWLYVYSDTGEHYVIKQCFPNRRSLSVNSLTPVKSEVMRVRSKSANKRRS